MPLSIRPPKLEDAKAVCDLVIACDIEDFGAPTLTWGNYWICGKGLTFNIMCGLLTMKHPKSWDIP
jgi:hypothetical protein